MKNQLNSEILGEYTNVIKAFKNRYDVQNGKALGYRKNQDPKGELLPQNTPHSVGEGLSTTGYCVSVSQALLNDNAFKKLLDYRGASAKLVSIDIKEQYYGECYNSSKNTWHTAILVTDGGLNLIIDMTCAQFGNRFVEKFIWAFDTWQKTFRSPSCKHKIVDALGRELKYSTVVPASIKEENAVSHIECSPCNPDALDDSNYALDSQKEKIKFALDKEVLLRTEEVSLLTDFFYTKMRDLNIKLLSGMLNKYDINYNNAVCRCLSKMSLKKTKEAYYYVMKFDNKQESLKFLMLLEKGEFLLNHYVVAKKNLQDTISHYYNINKQDMKDSDPHFIVFEFITPIESIDISAICENSVLIPYGTLLEMNNPQEQIYNGSKLLNDSILNTQKTNTIYVRL